MKERQNGGVSAPARWDGRRVLFDMGHDGEQVHCAVSPDALRELTSRRCFKPCDVLDRLSGGALADRGYRTRQASAPDYAVSDAADGLARRRGGLPCSVRLGRGDASVRRFVSEHRFRLMLAFCVVALILMRFGRPVEG
jgi:hypothetical protein